MLSKDMYGQTDISHLFVIVVQPICCAQVGVSPACRCPSGEVALGQTLVKLHSGDASLSISFPIGMTYLPGKMTEEIYS